jgi:hypothetical protein
VSLLEKVGYTRVRHYHGGMAEWSERGAPIEISALPPAEPALQAARRQSHGARFSWLEILAGWPLERLIGIWLGMIAVFGVIYWLAGLGMGWSLRAGSDWVKPDLEGLETALYFSFVTALSVGYGDVIPTGVLRIPAVIEGIAGLLIFGCVISKLVSRRQEELTEEIHRTTFDDRLDRVRTNLHLVFSDLGAVQQLQAERGALPGQVLRRLESAVRVFRGELQTIHDLLYASRMEPDEETLESLLANLVICLQTLVEMNTVSPPGTEPSTSLEAGLRSVGTLAAEICGECVPRQHAQALKNSMDQIRELARRIV